MPSYSRAVAIAVLVACAAAVLAADPTPAELVKQLGDKQYAAREEASKRLKALGEAARPALEAGLKSTSPEVVSRAKKILAEFDRGILPDTPKETLKLIDDFIGGPPENRFAVAKKLLETGPKGVAQLERLLKKDFGSLEERQQFFSQLMYHSRQAVPILLFDKKDDEAERLLRLNTYGPNISAQLDYVVFMAQKSKLAGVLAEIADNRTLPGQVGKAAGTTLLCAYRVADEKAKLKALLADLPKDDPALWALREGLLLDIGDWATLAEDAVDSPNSQTGLKAYRLRQAGKHKEADKLLAEIKENDPAAVGQYSIEEGALALLLNGKTEDGIARLKASESAPHVLTDIMAVRLQFADAMDVIKAGLAAKPNPEDEERAGQVLTNLYLAKKGRLLAQLGQRDAAVQVFNTMTEKTNFYDSTALIQLVKAEVRSGFPDLAAELLGKAQAQYDADGNRQPYYTGQDPYEILFDADAEAALFWWSALKKIDDKETPSARMVRIRHLLTGKLPADKVKALTVEAAKLKFTPAEGRRRVQTELVTPFRRAMGLAAGYRMGGDTESAVAVLSDHTLVMQKNKKKPRDPDDDVEFDGFGGIDRTPGGRQWVYGVDESFRLWLDLAELLAAQKKHKEAADKLLDGWRLTPENGLLLYFSGKALLKAGDEAEGKRRIALSHVVPLSQARVRARFLEELANRGTDTAELRIACAAARQAGWLTEGNAGNVWNQIGRAAAILKDFAGAASANRRAVHYVLRTQGVSYVEGYAYVNVVVSVMSFEARQLLADGKPDEALTAARQALALMPSHTDLVIGLMPGLEKAGRKKDADALFRQGWDAFQQVIKDHPKSAWARHTAAWLAAGCNRELDTALEYAKKAVELEPESKANRSGLAEASFRKGDRAKALEVMTKLAAEDRRNHFFQRQLERYKTAPFDAPLPETDDE